MKAYLDTNVILDYLLDSCGPFHEPAVRLMRAVGIGTIGAGFSTTQAIDLYSSLRKAAGDDVARRSLRGLFTLCELFVTPADACVAALDSPMDDFEDTVQVETARFHNCDFIVTRDNRDYADSDVPALDPAAFLEQLDQSH